MTGTKQILLAGFAALCMVLPACRSTTEAENAATLPLVVSAASLNSASYTAEYTQDGALPFTCEVKLGTDGRIRRDYVWKDEKGAEKKVSVVLNDKTAVRLEDGKSTVLKDADAEKERFFAGLILAPGSFVSGAAAKKDAPVQSVSDGDSGRVYALELSGVPGVESCLVSADRESHLWSALYVRMADDPDEVFSTKFQEYKTESGVTYPSRIISSTENGAPVSCTIRDVKINPELPDELFRLPGATNG